MKFFVFIPGFLWSNPCDKEGEGEKIKIQFKTLLEMWEKYYFITVQCHYFKFIKKRLNKKHHEF